MNSLKLEEPKKQIGIIIKHNPTSERIIIPIMQQVAFLHHCAFSNEVSSDGFNEDIANALITIGTKMRKRLKKERRFSNINKG